MKGFKNIAILLATVVAMASCDLLNVDVDTSFSGTLDVDVPESTLKGSMAWTGFNAETILYPGDNEELVEYADQIVAVGVSNVEATVTYLTVESITLSPQTMISMSDGTTTAEWYSESEWTIYRDSTYKLEDINSFYTNLETILQVSEEEIDETEWTLRITGNSSEGGVSFGLEVTIIGTVTGSIL